MALKKKDDGFEAIKLEAEEAGVNLAKAADGTYAAAVVGGHSIDGYATARACLDDMLAILEMDERDDVYAYDNGDMGGYVVTVTGVSERFEDESLAGAFAKAKEAVVQATKPEVTPPVEPTEVIAPVKPNGAEKAQMRRDDLTETLAQGYLDLAATFTSLATALKAGEGVVPFVQQGFDEGEPEAAPKARSRITREKRK